MAAKVKSAGNRKPALIEIARKERKEFFNCHKNTQKAQKKNSPNYAFCFFAFFCGHFGGKNFYMRLPCVSQGNGGVSPPLARAGGVSVSERLNAGMNVSAK